MAARSTAHEHARNLLVQQGFPGAVVVHVESYGDAELGAEQILFVTKHRKAKTAFVWAERLPIKRVMVKVEKGWVGGKRIPR